MDINLLDLLKDSSLASLFIYQESGKIVYANRAFAKLLDRDLGEIIDKTFFEFISQNKAEKLESKKTIEKRLSGENFVKEFVEVNFLRKDKTLVSTYITSYTVDFQGKKSGLVMIIDKSTEESYKKLLTSLLKINQLIQNEKNKESLIDNVCKILVEEIGFFIAIFGNIDENKLFNPISIKTRDKKVRKPLELFLKSHRIGTDINTAYGKGSVSEAYHTKNISLRTNVLNDQNHSYWAEFYKRYSIDSLCSIPIVRNETVEYIILILDNFKESFSLENIKLIEELKRDLSYAFEKFEKDRLLKITKYAIDQAHEWVVITDRNANIIFVNDAVLKISGYAKEEIIGKRPSIFKSGLIDNEVYKNMWYELHNKRVFKYKFADRAKDGHIFFLDAIISPILKNNEIEHFISLGRDITDLVKLEEEEKRRQNQLNLMVNGLPNPAWLIKNYKIIYQNKAAKNFFQSRLGGYCWNEIYKSKFIAKDQKNALQNSNINPEKTCNFCLLKSAHKEGIAKNRIVNFGERFFETWWVPVGPDLSLHYVIDVTRYKTMEKDLKELSNKDFLTGLSNRRYFMIRLQEELERYKRSGVTFSLAMLDIDHFKKVNDIFGHDMGDKVLVEFCKNVKNRIRKIDTFARFGGEEFMLILPNTKVEKAIKLSEELRILAETIDVNGIRFTVSIGVVDVCKSDTVESLIRNVDDLLYEAKNSGRNCIKFKKYCV